MFELMLMRHAKSDWHSHTSDIDRPLNKRGRDNAVRMGAHLGQMGFIPDKMLVSAAQRTQETASLLLNNLPVPAENIIVDKSLYLADRDTLCESAGLYAENNRRLLILAHNPGMDDIVSFLASKTLPLSASGKLMTTCAVACFRMASVEALTKKSTGELLCLIRPSEI